MRSEKSTRRNGFTQMDETKEKKAEGEEARKQTETFCGGEKSAKCSHLPRTKTGNHCLIRARRGKRDPLNLNRKNQ